MHVASSIQKVMAPLNEALEENSTLGAQVQTEGVSRVPRLNSFFWNFQLKARLRAVVLYWNEMKM